MTDRVWKALKSSLVIRMDVYRGWERAHAPSTHKLAKKKQRKGQGLSVLLSLRTISCFSFLLSGGFHGGCGILWSRSFLSLFLFLRLHLVMERLRFSSHFMYMPPFTLCPTKARQIIIPLVTPLSTKTKGRAHRSYTPSEGGKGE